MTTKDIIRRSGRSLLAAKARTVLTALAIGVGAFALTLTLGASNGAQQYADTIVKNNFDPSQLIVTADGSLFGAVDASRPQEYSPNLGAVTGPGGGTTQIEMLDDDDVAKIRSINGINEVQTVDTQGLQYVTRNGQRKYAATAQMYNTYRQPELLAGSLKSGLSDTQVMVPEGFLASLGFSSAKQAIGKTVRLAVQPQIDVSSLLSAGASAVTDRPSTEVEFTIVAVNKKPSVLLQASVGLYLTLNSTAIRSLNETATRGSAGYHQYISVTATVKNGQDRSALSAAQDRIKHVGYAAQSVADTQKTITQVIGVLQGIVTVFGSIAVVASVFGVVNTMYISVLQRTREIGLMKALGMHKADVTKLFLSEAGLIGFIGGTLGVVVGLVVGVVLNPFISEKLDLGASRLLIFEPLQLAILVAALTLVAVVAGLLPARKAAQLDPIVALRTE